MEKRLYRSKQNKVIAGICGGIAEYFSLDPTIVRVIWVLITLLGGTGILAYLICIFIIPEGPEYEVFDADYSQGQEKYGYYDEEKRLNNSEKNKMILGIIFVILGVIFFLRRYYWFDMRTLLPFVLIIIGGYMIINSKKGNKIE